MQVSMIFKYLLTTSLAIFILCFNANATQNNIQSDINCLEDAKKCLSEIEQNNKKNKQTQNDIKKSIALITQLVKAHSLGKITDDDLPLFYKTYLNTMIFFAKTKNIAILDQISALILYNQHMLYYTGVSYLLSQENNKAIDFLTQCLFLNQHNLLCLFNIATAYDGTGNFKNAIFYYKAFLKSCKEDKTANQNTCNNYTSAVEERLQNLKEKYFYS